MPRKGSSANEYRQHLLKQASETAAAEERNRLARDLHDSIKQQIFSIHLSAIAAQAQVGVNATKAQEALADIQRSAQEAQIEMQALLQQLRPAALEHTSFAEAVQTQAQALEYRSGVRVLVKLAELPALDRCPLPMQETAFRIVQEAFANIARHARACQVECIVTHDDEALDVVIHDDGQGFDPQNISQGLGLASMRERVHNLHGTATIESAPGHGTTLHTQIPLLLPSEIRQRQEQQEQKVQNGAAQARAGLQLRSTMAVFTLLVILIDIDLGLFMPGVSQTSKEFVLSILGFCLFLMFYGLVSTRVANSRLALYRGKNDREVCALRFQEHRGWTASLRLALFSSWHIVLWCWPVFLGMASWQVASGFLVGAGLILALVLFEQRRLKFAQDTYYSLLASQTLKRTVERHRNMLRIRVILTLCIAISLSVNGPMPFFSSSLLPRLLADTFLFAFSIQCLCLLIDTWQLQPWRRVIATTARG